MAWAYIKGFDKKYKIYDTGEVYSCMKKKFMKITVKGNHKSIFLRKDGNVEYIMLSILLKEHFGIVEEGEKIPDLEGEIWKPIEGFEGLYTISNKGRVKSLVAGQKKNELLIKYNYNKKGNLYFSISKNDKKTSMLLHRALAVAFIPNPYNKKLAVHINGDKLDNRLENIKWMSDSDSQRNARSIGLLETPIGGDNKCSLKVNQYTPDGLHLIKTWDCITDVERELGIFRSNIVKVCKGKRNMAGGYFWGYPEDEI